MEITLKDNISLLKQLKNNEIIFQEKNNIRWKIKLINENCKDLKVADLEILKLDELNALYNDFFTKYIESISSDTVIEYKIKEINEITAIEAEKVIDVLIEEDDWMLTKYYKIAWILWNWLEELSKLNLTSFNALIEKLDEIKEEIVKKN
jgi:hypothetical protein